MLKAHHISSSGAKKRSKFTLPAEYDGRVSQGALYHAVRALLSNQRQGTHSTKTRSEVSGGNQKPWRQKGTGRARQGTTRAAHWRGGGVVFGPKPRDYRIDLPRKVKRLARRSALNARANENALYVIERFAFEQPKTKQLLELLGKLELSGRKVLVLTADVQPAVYRSGRNIPTVHVMQYAEATALEVLWADALLVEQAALGTESASPDQDVGADDA